MKEKWTAPVLPEKIPCGDMPGDKIQIGEEHIRKAQTIFPVLKEIIDSRGGARTVVSVCGGSGVGKSEIASLLAFYLRSAGLGAYVLSGDNYPRRIPRANDEERLRVYRQGGLYKDIFDASARSMNVDKIASTMMTLFFAVIML